MYSVFKLSVVPQTAMCCFVSEHILFHALVASVFFCLFAYLKILDQICFSEVKALMTQKYS